jgi:mono/diheme cytochrome c family protein/uncharacterized membrane protein
MPAFLGKLNKDQARGLVTYTRAFAPAKEKPRKKEQAEPTDTRFEEHYHRLQQELDELQKESRQLSKAPLDGGPPDPSEVSADQESSRPSEPPPQEALPSATPAPAETPAVRDLFRRHCGKCHGRDGTGGPARGLLPEIPNFADVSWHGHQSDAQLLVSILAGTESGMPAFRTKISEDQALRLVGYVRDFISTPDKSERKRQEDPSPADLAEAVPPRSFSEKLLGWLGRFHLPAVHFPIALLTAAAVAELLRLATGTPVFDATSRYCLWFGFLTAVVAGTLGWFLGGFHLADASWVMMTHRWLGTSTIAGAGLVVVLSEVSRRPDRRRTRVLFRVALLVVALIVPVTGFFGGAVVLGIDHYSWTP